MSRKKQENIYCLGTIDQQRQEVKSIYKMSQEERRRPVRLAAAGELKSSILF